MVVAMEGEWNYECDLSLTLSINLSGLNYPVGPFVIILNMSEGDVICRTILQYNFNSRTQHCRKNQHLYYPTVGRAA